ncbi:uncharacterized protein LOC105702757 isoform X2 [Orussus abietinus]|uniref:uncharacterized protein LOC105702757 isoform X2 n=1 Tax=Orussus abietinus TaxID=222816 RepID=UPI0006250A02|nr:uncharacterized protein LOC105702757 isoform X2 [Orussus abietinus]
MKMSKWATITLSLLLAKSIEAKIERNLIGSSDGLKAIEHVERLCKNETHADSSASEGIIVKEDRKTEKCVNRTVGNTSSKENSKHRRTSYKDNKIDWNSVKKFALQMPRDLRTRESNLKGDTFESGNLSPFFNLRLNKETESLSDKTKEASIKSGHLEKQKGYDLEPGNFSNSLSKTRLLQIKGIKSVLIKDMLKVVLNKLMNNKTLQTEELDGPRTENLPDNSLYELSSNERLVNKSVINVDQNYTKKELLELNRRRSPDDKYINTLSKTRLLQIEGIKSVLIKDLLKVVLNKLMNNKTLQTKELDGPRTENLPDNSLYELSSNERLVTESVINVDQNYTRKKLLELNRRRSPDDKYMNTLRYLRKFPNWAHLYNKSVNAWERKETRNSMLQAQHLRLLDMKNALRRQSTSKETFQDKSTVLEMEKSKRIKVKTPVWGNVTNMEKDSWITPCRTENGSNETCDTFNVSSSLAKQINSKSKTIYSKIQHIDSRSSLIPSKNEEEIEGRERRQVSNDNNEDIWLRLGFNGYRNLLSMHAFFIRDENIKKCGAPTTWKTGAILTSTLAITSASCIYKALYDEHHIQGQLAVLVGIGPIFSYVVTVTRYSLHPKYSEQNDFVTHGVAVVYFDCPVPEGEIGFPKLSTDATDVNRKCCKDTCPILTVVQHPANTHVVRLMTPKHLLMADANKIKKDIISNITNVTEAPLVSSSTDRSKMETARLEKSVSNKRRPSREITFGRDVTTLHGNVTELNVAPKVVREDPNLPKQPDAKNVSYTNVKAVKDYSKWIVSELMRRFMSAIDPMLETSLNLHDMLDIGHHNSSQEYADRVADIITQGALATSTSFLHL